jgi:DNA polymerase III epsilon subunit-like protein
MSNTIIFIDIETGGLDPFKHSMLRFNYAVVYDGGMYDNGVLNLRQEEYVVTSKAMEINKIDLRIHEEDSVTPKQFYNEMQNLLQKYYPNKQKDKYYACLGGYNVSFDLTFLRRFFNLHFESNFYNTWFDNTVMDVASMLRLLHTVGALPQAFYKIDQALSFFNVDMDSNPATTVANLYLAMEGLLKG